MESPLESRKSRRMDRQPPLCMVATAFSDPRNITMIIFIAWKIAAKADQEISRDISTTGKITVPIIYHRRKNET